MPALDAPPARKYHVDAMDDATTLRNVLEAAPCSARQLALEAGVSPALLTRIQKGERAMTSETRAALADALRKWSRDCDEAAELLTEGGDNE